jgi:hypothetical protein
MNVPELQVEVTWTREATRVEAALTAETSAKEATMALYSATILVKDEGDRTTLWIGKLGRGC